MDLLRGKTREGTKIPLPQGNAKGRFLAVCAILAVVYLGFSFAFNAYADPPASPYAPGTTLNPTCPPTGPSSTNCTVLPPLFSTTTLPIGGILYTSDASGTVTAATTTLYWNPTAGEFTVGGNGSLGLPTQNGTTSLLLLGSNQLSGGNVSGTFIGSNVTSGYRGDWINFQLASSSVFQVNASGSLIIAGNATTTNLTITAITNALHLGSGTGATTAYGGSNCATGMAAISFSATGTVICATASTLTTSTDGVANFLPLWTSASALGNSWLQQTANSLVIATGTGTWTLNSTTDSFLQLGSSSIQDGNTSGTFFGINASSGFNGDFQNFQVNSSTEFKVASSGAFLFAGNGLVGGKLNVTGTLSDAGGIMIATGTAAPNALLTIATGTSIFSVSSNGLVAISTKNGSLAIATGSQWSASTTLTVCAHTNCKLPTTASTSNTVAVFASVNGGSTTTSIIARGSILGGQTDVGEFIPVIGTDEDYGQGDIVSVTASSSVAFEKSKTAYDPKVAGVVTITAGFIAGGGEDSHGTTVIALAGRILVNVTMQNGQIHTGDYLTSSNIPGVAMRATQPGRIIGMALMDDLGNINNPNATSQVMMFVNPGWSLGSVTSATEIASSSWALTNASSGGAFIIDQFTAYVQAALAKLGLVISNGVATLQGIVANKISTNQLCVQGTCVTGNQLSNLLNNNSTNNSGGGSAQPAAAPAPAPALAGPASSSSSTDIAASTTPLATPSSTNLVMPPASSTPNSSSSSP